MNTINTMKTTYAVMFTITIMLVLGCIGKLKQINDRIDEIDKPVVVATVNFDEKMLMHIAKMEQDLDMAKARIEDLEYRMDAYTNIIKQTAK